MDQSNEQPRALSPEEGERFLKLFGENHKGLLGYVYSLVPHAQNAEDICQKTSLVLWRKCHQLEPNGDFMAWACRVAYLEVCNFRRTASRDRLCFSDELLAYLAEDRLDDLRNVNRRMDALRDYQEDDSLDIVEPANWSVVSQDLRSDALLNRVQISSEGNATRWFDEIRLGTSWRAVIPINKATRINNNSPKTGPAEDAASRGRRAAREVRYPYYEEISQQ